MGLGGGVGDAKRAREVVVERRRRVEGVDGARDAGRRGIFVGLGEKMYV